MKTTITIASGPSREELFDCLRLFIEKRSTDFILVKNKIKYLTPLIIAGIDAVDKDGEQGESWIIKFKVDYTKFIVSGDILPDLASNSINLKSIAYYSTRTRKGTITTE